MLGLILTRVLRQPPAFQVLLSVIRILASKLHIPVERGIFLKEEGNTTHGGKVDCIKVYMHFQKGVK